MNERGGEKKWKYYLHRIQDNSPTGSTGCHDTNHHGCHNSDAITSGNMALHIRRGLKRLGSLLEGERGGVVSVSMSVCGWAKVRDRCAGMCVRACVQGGMRDDACV